MSFDSPGAAQARALACEQDYEGAARLGAAAEPENASNLWSVSPYLLLLPASGVGYVTLNVDAPHFDWLLYLPADVNVESLDGPALLHNGAVADCPARMLAEHGAHHEQVTSWLLRLEGAPGTRIQVYAGLAPTDHSDLEHAGHAAHLLHEEHGADDDAGVDTHAL